MTTDANGELAVSLLQVPPGFTMNAQDAWPITFDPTRRTVASA